MSIQKNTPDKSNVKYVSADGHFEVIYNKNGVLLSEKNDPANMGTYNYASPTNDAVNHVILDWATYKKWYNTKQEYEKAQVENLEKIEDRARTIIK